MAAGAFALRFLDWCFSRIILEPFDSSDAYGQSVYGSPIADIPCHIEERVRMIREAQWQERASTTTLYVLAGPIDPRDRIAMPSSFKGANQPPILSVSNVNDKTAFSH